MLALLLQAQACSALLKADDSTFAVQRGDAAVQRGDAAPVPAVPLGGPTRFSHPKGKLGTAFGAPVVLTGDTLAVGAAFEDVKTDAGLLKQAGATYLFDLNDSTASARRIVVPNAGEGDGLLPPDVVPVGVTNTGFDFPSLRLALSDRLLVIGVPTEDSASEDHPSDNSAQDSGAVYVYDRAALDAPPQYIKAPVPRAGNLFGHSLALSGSWLAIGAPSDGNGTSTPLWMKPQPGSEDGAHKSGAVYLYHRNETDGRFDDLPQYVKAPVIGAEDWFGVSVAMEGDVLVIGATAEDGGGTGINGDPNDRSSTNSGAAYVYQLDTDHWQFKQYLKPITNNRFVGAAGGFGWSVAVSGTHIAVGSGYASACTERDVRGSGRGSVHIFDTTTWAEDCVGPASGGFEVLFGWSIALADNRLLVGAIWDRSATEKDPTDQNAPGSGAAYLFDLEPGGWKQRNYLKGSPTNLAFGYSVAMGPGRAAVGSDEQTGLTDARAPVLDGSAYVYSLPN